MNELYATYSEWQTQLSDLSAQATEASSADNLDNLTETQRELERLYIRYSQRMSFELAYGKDEQLADLADVFRTMSAEYEREWFALNKRITAEINTELSEWFSEVGCEE